MESTIIAIMLASAVVFWNAPFAVYAIPINKVLRRHWRHILFVILLLLLITSQTHTSPSAIPTARCKGQAYATACHASQKALTITTLSAPSIF